MPTTLWSKLIPYEHQLIGQWTEDAIRRSTNYEGNILEQELAQAIMNIYLSEHTRKLGEMDIGQYDKENQLLRQAPRFKRLVLTIGLQHHHEENWLNHTYRFANTNSTNFKELIFNFYASIFNPEELDSVRRVLDTKIHDI